MSTNYKVIGAKAVLGVGLTLKLTDKQANIRKSTLKIKKKGIYIVLEPVEFKQGEIIVIVDGTVSKSVLANLEDLSPKKPKKQEPQKTAKVASKKDKKTNPTPPKTPEDNGEDEEDDLTNPDDNDSSNDGDEDSQPETDDESIVDNGDINNLPVATK